MMTGGLRSSLSCGSDVMAADGDTLTNMYTNYAKYHWKCHSLQTRGVSGTYPWYSGREGS